MPEGSRPDRVSEEFREILAEEIPKLKDPRVGFVTVLGVTVTPDLRLARVFANHYGTNAASGRVMEKIGMRREGLFRQHQLKWGVSMDVVCYGILAADLRPPGGSPHEPDAARRVADR